MPQIRVSEDDLHTGQCDKHWCNHSYAGWLVSQAPDVLWYDVQDVGSYSGQVFAVGLYRANILLFSDYYGSCSGCGAWGEGGEPTDQEDVLASSHLFLSASEAVEYVQREWSEAFERPDLSQTALAIVAAAADKASWSIYYPSMPC